MVMPVTRVTSALSRRFSIRSSDMDDDAPDIGTNAPPE
jgi:hypothetical protein